MAAEHVAAHDGGPQVCEGFLDDRGARVHFPAFQALHGAPSRKWEHPLVQAHAADAERILHVLAGAGHVAVEGHRDPQAQLGHVLPHSIETAAHNAAQTLAVSHKTDSCSKALR